MGLWSYKAVKSLFLAMRANVKQEAVLLSLWVLASRPRCFKRVVRELHFRSMQVIATFFLLVALALSMLIEKVFKSPVPCS